MVFWNVKSRSGFGAFWALHHEDLMPDPVSFNARAVFTFSADRIYRVESRDGALYFLCLGVQFDRDQDQNPEELLAIDPHNFKLVPSEIKRVTFLAKKSFPSHGPHVARLIIEYFDGKRQEYHFENTADLHTATEQLSAFLSHPHRRAA
jgi:hypothetical protein